MESTKLVPLGIYNPSMCISCNGRLALVKKFDLHDRSLVVKIMGGQNNKNKGDLTINGYNQLMQLQNLLYFTDDPSCML